MSLIITAVSSVCATVFLYSGFLHVKNLLSQSLIYKDTPCLFDMNKQFEIQYKKAKKQGCYGEMGRIAEQMAKIEKELEFRFENTRVESL